MTGGLVRESFHPGLGRMVPLSREVWTGSMYTDPRTVTGAPLTGRLGEQSEAFRDACAEGRIKPVFSLFVRSGVDEKLLALTCTPGNFTVVRDTEGAFAFRAILDPLSPVRGPTRRWYLLVIGPDGTITLTPHDAPDDRRARQVLP